MKKLAQSAAFLYLLTLVPLAQAMHHETMDHSGDKMSEPMMMSEPAMMPSETIVDIASGNDDFSTLVDLVVMAELAETLASAGPFTVFAPSNEAFARMPALYQRKLAEDPSLLAEVLLAHVVPGKVMAADVLGMDQATTASNQTLSVGVWNGMPFIGDAYITATDIEASNGVVHVIDRVIFPRELLR